MYVHPSRYSCIQNSVFSILKESHQEKCFLMSRLTRARRVKNVVNFTVYRSLSFITLTRILVGFKIYKVYLLSKIGSPTGRDNRCDALFVGQPPNTPYRHRTDKFRPSIMKTLSVDVDAISIASKFDRQIQLITDTTK